MDYSTFVKSTVCSWEDDIYKMLQKTLVGEYLSFSIVSDAEITKEILAEKICDYFEKLELKTGKSFEKYINVYMDNIESLVDQYVAKTPQPKKKDTTPIVVPRSRKYFEKAQSIRKSRSLSVRNLVDFTRIMMCLYTAAISNKYKEIKNFDFSAACIDPDTIITSMKNEESAILKIRKKRFDIKDLYCADTCTFILTIIILHKIVGDKVQGEYYHE